jgi:hypothetical protein
VLFRSREGEGNRYVLSTKLHGVTFQKTVAICPILKGFGDDVQHSLTAGFLDFVHRPEF